MKRTIILTFAVLLFLASVIFIVVLIIDKDLLSSNDIILYANGVKGTNDDSLLHNGDIYISKEYLINNELIDLYWDKDYNRVSIFDNYKFHKITYNLYKAIYNKQIVDVEDILLVKNDELYLNVEFIEDKFLKNICVDKQSKIVVISDVQKEYIITAKTSILNRTSRDDSLIQSVEENEVISIYDYIDGDYIMCKTLDGSIGFVDYESIKPYKTTIEKLFEKEKRQESIVLTWDLLSNKVTNFKPFDIPAAVDIIAPTWYDLKDDEEYFIDISSDEYTKYVQSTGKKVWATFNNSFDPELTNLLLNNAYKRSKIVDRIIQITKDNNYDGINIDFENVYMKDRDVYSVFIKELYCKAKKENIPMSVDVAVLSSSETWSKFLDRKAIGQYSDYVILMAYDENVSGNSGSVSSLPWVEYGVENLLESVFEGKVVMAVPFYTRLWEESNVDGKLKVKATSLRLASAKRIIDDLGIELSYDEETGQNYGEKLVDGIKCRIWYEDETSLNSRMDIIKKYDLVGKGVWALSFGTDEMWELLK